MGTTNAGSFFDRKPLNEDVESEAGIVRGTQCSVKLVDEFEADEQLAFFPDFRSPGLPLTESCH